MNIIICGVGRVGLSIASYLSLHNNNITVIDSDPHLVKRVSDTYDITGLVGHASQPDILKKAGAESADIIIAVTDCDEVNMVACQVAHSIFGINKKIARIRNKEYRDTAWSNLFSRNHMPIDVIISPEEEIADAIIDRMSVPGTTNDISFVDNQVHVSGFIVDEDSELLNQRLRDVYYAQKDYEFRIFIFIRGGQAISFDDETLIEEGDEIYFICDKSILFSLLPEFGVKQIQQSQNMVVCGGGVIGAALCENIENHPTFSKGQLTIIENDMARARILNRRFKNALILNGSALDYDILKEANVEKTSSFITVMNSNENNILSAVLAKKMGADYSIALSNNRLYSQLLPDRIIDAIVNPETITVSKILHNLQRGAVVAVHTIRDTKIELIEAKVTNDCGIVELPMKELNLPKGLTIIGVYCNNEEKMIFPCDSTKIKCSDTLILKANNVKSEEIDKLFSFSINLF